jgi:hypothetical protein
MGRSLVQGIPADCDAGSRNLQNEAALARVGLLRLSHIQIPIHFHTYYTSPTHELFRQTMLDGPRFVRLHEQ